MTQEESLQERIEYLQNCCQKIVFSSQQLITLGPFGKTSGCELNCKDQLEKTLAGALFAVSLMAEHKNIDQLKILQHCANHAKDAHSNLHLQDLDILQHLQNQIEIQVMHESNNQYN